MGKKVLRTKLCDILGIEYPILSAGMGPTLIGEKTGAPVELVVAVSEAGGLGVLGGSGFTVDELRDAIREIKAQTDKPYGVDLLLPPRLATRDAMGMEGIEELPLNQVIERSEEHTSELQSRETRSYAVLCLKKKKKKLRRLLSDERYQGQSGLMGDCTGPKP